MTRYTTLAPCGIGTGAPTTGGTTFRAALFGVLALLSLSLVTLVPHPETATSALETTPGEASPAPALAWIGAQPNTPAPASVPADTKQRVQDA